MTDSWTVVGAWGPFPAPGGALRGHLLRQVGAAALLVGCGSGISGRLEYHLPEWQELGAVLLPDLHPAHAADLHALGSRCASMAVRGARRGLLPVYAPMDDPAFAALGRPGVLDPRAVAAGNESRVGGWHVRWHATASGGLAVRLRGAAGTAAFIPAGGVDPALATFVAGVGLLVVECGDPDGEASAEDVLASARRAGELAREAAVDALLLSHLEPTVGVEPTVAAARDAFPRAQCALEGRTYDLPTDSANSQG